MIYIIRARTAPLPTVETPDGSRLAHFCYIYFIIILRSVAGVRAFVMCFGQQFTQLFRKLNGFAARNLTRIKLCATHKLEVKWRNDF